MEGSEGGDADVAGVRWQHSRLLAAARGGARQGGHCEVWQEHSYARPRPGGDVSSLLGGPGGEPRELDVCRVSPPPRPLPNDSPPPLAPAVPQAEDADDRWEAAVVALAPSSSCALAARALCRLLSALWLRRLAGEPAGKATRQEQARHCARRLSHVLASLWVPTAGGGAGGAGCGAAWVVHAVSAHAPNETRALLEEVLAELRALLPRLAGRLPPGPVASPAPWAGGGPPAPADRRPLLCWAPSGCPEGDARWTRRLRPLLDTRLLGGRAPPGGSLPPDAWAAALAGAARRALLEALAEAGPRGVLLGGAGGGAALAVALCGVVGGAAEGRLRGLALLAPPPLTAEGALSLPDVPPALVVAGGGGGGGGRWLALGARRVRLVAGGDSLLRVPAPRRARLRLPQAAVDAAVAEEVCLWAGEVCARESSPGEEEYAHLPPSSPSSPPPAVSRGPAGTPLPLPPPPPRRAPLAPSDIMQLPIVFADDSPSPVAAPAAAPAGGEHADEATLTVTSGHPRLKLGLASTGPSGVGSATTLQTLQYRRVIVAKRGGQGQGQARASRISPRTTNNDYHHLF